MIGAVICKSDTEPKVAAYEEEKPSLGLEGLLSLG